jgi:hypothetical protein
MDEWVHSYVPLHIICRQKPEDRHESEDINGGDDMGRGDC